MSNSSYFEVFTEGDKPFIIDISNYAEGRSGRRLPKSLSFTLVGYRYRPATPTCALFPPRLIVSSQNAFASNGQIVLNESGNRKTGASVSLIGRTSDSLSQCVDSDLAGYSFIIDVADVGNFPSSIVVSMAEGSVSPNTISINATTGLPIASPTDAALKALMFSALVSKTYGQLNAVALPIGLSKSFYTPTALSLEEQMYGVGTTAEYFIGTHLHEFNNLALAAPINRGALLTRTPLFIARTSVTPPNWTTGGVAYAITFGSPGSTWVDDLLQKGSALSFFYRVHSITGDDTSPLVIQRFDILVGDLIPPPDRGTAAIDTYYPTTLVSDIYREYVSVYKIYILPNTESLITPTSTSDSLITDNVVIPITRKEKSSFAGTFSMRFNY